jgi:hypothetical protein
MRHRLVGLVAVSFVATSACGCGGGGSPLADGRQVDASDAAADLPLPCPDAAPPELPDAATIDGRAACGGEAAVVGVTPYGPFVAENASAELAAGGCHGLSIRFGDGVGLGDKLWVAVGIPVTDWNQPFIGVYDVTGFVESQQGTLSVPAHVELTGGEAFRQDGGPAPIGAPVVVGRIDMNTGCGHVTGTFSMPICGVFTCQI